MAKKPLPADPRLAAKPAGKTGQPSAPASTATDHGVDELRSKLLKRLAVAALLVALLLGTLAFFDYLASAPEEEDDPLYSKPVPVVPKKEVSHPVKQAIDLPPPPEAAKPVLEEDKKAEAKPEPARDAPPPPKVEPQPAATTEPAKNAPLTTSTVSAGRKTAVEPSAAPSPAAANPRPAILAPVAKPSRVTGDATSAPPLLPTMPASGAGTAQPVTESGAKPTARVLETRQVAPPVLPPSPPRLLSGFVLQAGVFSSPQLAEELHAKLTLSGVPSTLETRVQVGPFRTRQEAEAAQAKLRDLGIQSVMLPPKGTRR